MPKDLQEMRQRVYEANIALPAHGLVKFTWGNVSEVCRELGRIVIKPSGVDYEKLSPENMVVTDLDGNVVEGDLNPSSDLATHVALYKAWPNVHAVVHTHSTEAVGWAQAGRDIPFYGTTHADYFYGPVPCARSLTAEEVNSAYEKKQVQSSSRNLNAVVSTQLLYQELLSVTMDHLPGARILLRQSTTALFLREVARMNRYTEQINPRVEPAPSYIMDKHYLRKHGPNAYYGQKGDEH